MRAAGLLARARRAWSWVLANDPTEAHAAQRLYAAGQLYITTGEPSFHTKFVSLANELRTASWPEQYHPAWFNLKLVWDGMLFSPYFFAYTTTDRAVDEGVRAWRCR